MALYPGTSAGNTDLINGWGLAASDYPPGDITPWLSGRDPNQTPTGPIIPPFELPPWPSGTTAPSQGRTLPPLQQPVPPPPTMGQVGATDPLGRARGGQLPPLQGKGPSTISQIGNLLTQLNKTRQAASGGGRAGGGGGGGSTYASIGHTGQAPSAPTVPYRSMTTPVPAQLNFPQPRPTPVFLGAFQQGGIVPATGLYPVQGGEQIIPKKKVQKVAKLHKGELVLPRYVGSYQDGGTVSSDGTPMTPEQIRQQQINAQQAADRAAARAAGQPIDQPTIDPTQQTQNQQPGFWATMKGVLTGNPPRYPMDERGPGGVSSTGPALLNPVALLAQARQQATGGGPQLPTYASPGIPGQTNLGTTQSPQYNMQQLQQQLLGQLAQGGGIGTVPQIPGGPAPGGQIRQGPSQYVIPPMPTYTDLSFMGKGSRTQARVSNAIGGLSSALTMFRQRQWDRTKTEVTAETQKRLVEQMNQQPPSQQGAQGAQGAQTSFYGQSPQDLYQPSQSRLSQFLQQQGMAPQAGTPTMTTAPQGTAGQPGAQAGQQQAVQQQAKQDPVMAGLVDSYNRTQDPKQKQQIGRTIQQLQKANERADKNWYQQLAKAQANPFGAEYAGIMQGYQNVSTQMQQQEVLEAQAMNAKAQALSNVNKALGLEPEPRFDPKSGQFLGNMTTGGYEKYLTQTHTAEIRKGSVEELQQQYIQQMRTGDTQGAQDTLTQIRLLNGAKTWEQNQNKWAQLQESEKFKSWQTQFNAKTRTDIAQLNAGKAPATILQTAQFANSALIQLNAAQGYFEDLTRRGILGSVTADKLENMLFGEGLIDPTLRPEDRMEIGKLRAALHYTSSATMRAHTGRTSREIYHDFVTTLGLGQGGDALTGAFEQTRSLLTDYANAASASNIQRLREGNVSQPSNAPPATPPQPQPAGTTGQTGGGGFTPPPPSSGGAAGGGIIQNPPAGANWTRYPGKDKQGKIQWGWFDQNRNYQGAAPAP